MNEIPHIQIERYINKQMTLNESDKFEAQLASDNILQEQLKATLASHEIINEAGRLELKATLESFETENKSTFKEIKTIPLWVKRILPIAALLIAFLAINQFELFTNSLTVSEVYGNNFDAYVAPSELRGFSDTGTTDWRDAMASYNSKNYDQALTKLRNLETDVPQYLISFYSGISAMSQMQPNFEEAIQYFDQVLDTDNDYIQQAHWYRALSLLKLNRKEDAKAIFKKIVASKSFNYKKAEKILEVKFKD